MKLLVFTNHSYMFWQFRRELMQALLKEHTVVLCTPFVGHEEDFPALGCRLIKTEINRRGINPIVDIGLFFRYCRIIKNEKPDMIITYSIKPNVYAGIAAQLYGLPYCANVQGLGTAFQRKGLASFVAVLYKVALRKAKRTFFENEVNAQEFCDRRIQTRDRQTVLNGAGVNLDTFTYRAYPTNSPIRFLYLGRIMKEKGIDELFYAAKRLNADGYKFILDLVGFYEDGYKKQVEELERDGIVKFHGFQENPVPFYSDADCVILPSYHEGMSNVLLEAAAVGRPLITSDIPGCREAVEEGTTGFLVQPKDGEALCQAMRAIMSKSADERAQMGLAGHARMAQMFDKNAVVDETLKKIFS